MSVPIKKICNECGKIDICHNWIYRGNEVTVEEIQESNNTTNPALDGSVYRGDFIKTNWAIGEDIFRLEHISCSIIDDYLDNHKIEKHEVIVKEPIWTLK